MSNFRNTASVEEIKLPPKSHFDARKFDPVGKYSKPDDTDCELFLLELAECGVPSEAARLIGRSEVPFQIMRDKDPHFAAAYDWAMRRASDVLLVEARNRAIKGTVKDVYYKGDVVGQVTEYSDTLLNTLLKNLHRDFKEDKDDGASAGQIGTIVIQTMPRPEDERAKADREAAAKIAQDKEPKE